MGHKRIFIRVPIEGDARLSFGDGVIILADTIDISAGGICVADLTDSPQVDTEYEVEVATRLRGKVRFSAVLAHRGEHGIGMKIVKIDGANLRLIHQLVLDFQATDAFVAQIEEGRFLDDWLVDEDGETVAVTFEEQ
ncbi:MAG: PilZ domain-containing protein [Desulfopila sp.]